MSINYYPKSIEIIRQIPCKESAIELLLAIAQKTPSAVTKAFAALNPPKTWEDKAVSLLKSGNGNFIAAIKLCRAETGADLKSAKEAVEKIMTDNCISR